MLILTKFVGYIIIPTLFIIVLLCETWINVYYELNIKLGTFFEISLNRFVTRPRHKIIVFKDQLKKVR